MKVAHTTKQRIAEIKCEANMPKDRLMNLLARLEEHSGTKRICRQLEVVIGKLEQWQNTRHV
jgi:hypothetical protein